MPQPSFYQLFRRSKYSREESDEAPATGRNRRELFSVAALAFVLKHDEAFRAHFLRTICEHQKPFRANAFVVECEEEHCTDLVITW
jgi:hypothetical protein